MIADLEALGALDSTGPSDSRQAVELGADYLLASSPRMRPPDSLERAVYERIASEPPRVTTDAEGRVTEINPAFTALCGHSFAEINGRKPGSLLQGPDTDPSSVETIRQAVKNGTGCLTELVNYHKDGSRYVVRVEVSPVRDESGRLTGFRAMETKIS
jgi:PAS domain S-box-containing protein